MSRIPTKIAIIATAIFSFTCGVIALALVSAAEGIYDTYEEEN